MATAHHTSTVAHCLVARPKQQVSDRRKPRAPLSSNQIKTTTLANTMRSFHQVVLFLFALVAFVAAQEGQSYDATVYVTSTIYKVNTVTLSSSPAYEVSNSTTTIAASSQATGAYSVPANSTAPYPTGTGASSGAPIAPTTTAFPGAASGLSVNGALVAMLAAGLGFLAL
ncbi:hypothetical protein SLS60_002197 [Paraconiothyrium brasiliense]|uniref:Uncharacterized protein n=1 Tax=Paraconiothyrium brasiliense TaxID=300254 RepID=A0ABR3S249_9PLEO